MAERESRAIAGLSMGAGQAMRIGLSHPDTFSSVGAFSGVGKVDLKTSFGGVFADPAALAAAIKALPITLVAARPIDEAISSAGGVRFDALDEALMLRSLPGVFCAGEMLDWEAPTGGYLLTACLASGQRAGWGVLSWLQRHGNRLP